LRQALFVRAKPKSAGVLQRLNAISTDRQTASRCQRLFGGYPILVVVGLHDRFALFPEVAATRPVSMI
jgi:hypothetical protein